MDLRRSRMFRFRSRILLLLVVPFWSIGNVLAYSVSFLDQSWLDVIPDTLQHLELEVSFLFFCKFSCLVNELSIMGPDCEPTSSLKEHGHEPDIVRINIASLLVNQLSGLRIGTFH